MQIIKTHFGEVKIDKEGIINFTQGLPGFNDLRSFVILPHEEGIPIYFLQSLDDTGVSFVIANPYAFFPEYQVDVPSEDLAELELPDLNNALIYVILVVSQDPANITANLLAPVIINPEKRLSKQIVMTGEKYTTKHRLFAK